MVQAILRRIGMKNVLLLAAVVMIAVFLFGCAQQQQQASFKEQDARKFVNDDLNAKFPDAEIKEIIELTPSVQNDSWQVKVRVTFNYSSPCPVRMNVYYDYPRKGFVATPPEYVTRECMVCANTASCILGTPEEAIIASHVLTGSDAVVNYIAAHSNAVPDAKFYSEYIDPASKTRYRDIWLVKWLSPTTNFGIFAMISDKGEVLKTWEVMRSEMI